MPEEVPLGEDFKDWHRNLNDAERNLLTQIFRFFTQSDVEVNDYYMERYARVFKPTEVKMMLSAFSNMETIHIAAYASCSRPSACRRSSSQAFLEIQGDEGQARLHAGLRGRLEVRHRPHPGHVRRLHRGLQLFASFAMLMNFPRFNKMKGMGQIVSWWVRDESLHCEGIIKLFRAFVQENPEIWTEDLKRDIIIACATMVGLEDRFIDLAFEAGAVQGMTARRTSRPTSASSPTGACASLGLNALYHVANNPLPWLESC